MPPTPGRYVQNGALYAEAWDLDHPTSFRLGTPLRDGRNENLIEYDANHHDLQYNNSKGTTWLDTTQRAQAKKSQEVDDPFLRQDWQ